MRLSGQKVQIVPVEDVRSRMPSRGRNGQNGILAHPFLEQEAARRIKQAAQIASRRYGLELVILDALRGPQAGVRSHWDATELEVLSHGTGGAVDVALMKDGELLPMGSAYGSNERDENAPVEAAANRELVRTILAEADFVRTEGNWWHYEYGTYAWARETGGPPI